MKKIRKHYSSKNAGPRQPGKQSRTITKGGDRHNSKKMNEGPHSNAWHRSVSPSPSIEQLFNRAHLDSTYSTAGEGSQMHPQDMSLFREHLRDVPRMRAKKSAARPTGSSKSRLPKLAKSKRKN